MERYSSIINRLKHYLPAQNPLKDFVHHNTLHAFQHEHFHEGLRTAAQNFGYQVYLPINEYRTLFSTHKISPKVLERCISLYYPEDKVNEWRDKLLFKPYDETKTQNLGQLRNLWNRYYKINLDKHVHAVLFRVIGNFLDQGIGAYSFPYKHLPFLEALKAIEKNSMNSFFKTTRSRALLLNESELLPRLLEMVVGDANLYEQYLFDQQFAHPGWSGMVAVVEDHPESLIERRTIRLHDFICFELLLEIDALDAKFGEIWKPLSMVLPEDFQPKLFTKNETSTELYEVYKIWQEAYEWSFYDEVLKGLQTKPTSIKPEATSFQSVFCIDDREESIRRNLEMADANCETFSTAGFFNIPIYFQPEKGLFATKVCPGPITPKHIIKEHQAKKRHKKDWHFSKRTHGFLGGLVSAPTMGFWSAVQLGWSIISPRPTTAMVSSFKHMDKSGELSIAFEGKTELDLQVGFTHEEMADKVAGLLKGIALVDNFAPLVYFLGHGASSTNNTHYAGYDCGACNGRAGSVNARVAAHMANKRAVRELLSLKGINIPAATQFLGGLHDTTRDEIAFFDEQLLSEENKILHEANKKVFQRALENNAVERSRRFLLLRNKSTKRKIHEKVKQRSVSLFEPRPEWNHATNALCIIGERNQNKHLFFDRRAFLNSYNHKLDHDGSILAGILNAVAPVCGGINLEYYFSRMDNHRLGAGSKLPHNVMGLIGVTNGMEGDLRTGLPMQMVNIHDPLRLLVIIEHFPAQVMEILQRNTATFEWFQNAWIHLVVVHPESMEIFVFKNGQFSPYEPLAESTMSPSNLDQVVRRTSTNLPIYQIA